MAVKVADTIKAMSNTFPVAECIDIDVNINGTTKRLQKAIDDGEIGGGDLTWKGTHEEWEALSTEEKGKYEVICFTDDYDDSGIGESDSSWKGTRDEWEALSTEEKQKYVIVYFTDDYDAADNTGLIDDSIISNKTTYSSTKIENSLSKKANTTDLTVHTSDTNIHVTTSDKTKWNNSVNKTDIIDNLTSTNTDKPLSAKQGKILKSEVGLKANATDLTSHTSDTSIHVTTSDKTKWNKVDNKVDKTDITTTIDSTSTDTQVPSAKAIYNKSKNGITHISKGEDITAYADSIGNQFVTDTVRLRDTTSSPYGVDNNSNDFYYTIYNMEDDKFKRIIAYDIRKNDMYMLIKSVGTWGTWKKVCTTCIADVPKTNIAPSDETKFIDFAGRCHYCVKNEVCYVSFWNVKINSAVGTISSGVILPKPKSGFFGGTCLIGDHDATPHAYVFILPNTGELCFNVKDPNVALYGSFSYPVEEQ